MSGRGLSAAFKNVVSGMAAHASFFYEFYFDEGTVWMTDGPRDVVWGGNTYLANGYVVSVDDIQESSAIQTNEITLGVSGIDGSWTTQVMFYNYINRRVVVRQVVFDSVTMDVVSDPIIVFDGRVSGVNFAEDPGEAAVVTFTVGNIWSNFQRAKGRRTNDSEQSALFTNPTPDRGFQWAMDTEKQIEWGSR